jgi:hypothetical protein
LFHQTVHGLLEGYIWLPDGRSHYLPEAGTILLQIAALERIEEQEAQEWAQRLARGWGCTEKQQPILLELVRVYREYGFDQFAAYTRRWASRSARPSSKRRSSAI